MPTAGAIFLWILICWAGPGSPTFAATTDEPSTSGGKECVILLHGLARTSGSLDRMEETLAKAGYHTVNLDYPSRSQPVERLAIAYVAEGFRRCAASGASPVHFVTHSMGGILVRYYLGKGIPSNLGRVVMLSPPNGGSEAAEQLRDEAYFQWLNGPAGQQLGTGPDGIAARLGPVEYPVGIITGNRHSFFDAWLSEMIPGEDDGKVSVERAKVEGMTDFLVLPYSHPFIMREDRTIAQTLHFLRHGRFQR